MVALVCLRAFASIRKEKIFLLYKNPEEYSLKYNFLAVTKARKF